MDQYLVFTPCGHGAHAECVGQVTANFGADPVETLVCSCVCHCTEEVAPGVFRIINDDAEMDAECAHFGCLSGSPVHAADACECSCHA